MNILFLLDKEAGTELSEALKDGILRVLGENGHIVDVFELGKQDAAPCIGCLRCVTRHPGECVSKDLVNEIRKKVKDYSATIFLTPVIFGHYSATMASPINKGTGSHDLQIFIGYGEDLTEEEKSTFIDLTAKHRGQADIVHPGIDKQVDVYITESLEDNQRICQVLGGYAGVKG